MLKHQPVAWDSFQKRSPLQGNRPILCSWQYHSVTWSLYSFRLFAGHFYRTSFGSSNNFITTGIAVAFACEKIKKLGNFVLPMNTHPMRDRAKDCHLVFPLSGHRQGWRQGLGEGRVLGSYSPTWLECCVTQVWLTYLQQELNSCSQKEGATEGWGVAEW